MPRIHCPPVSSQQRSHANLDSIRFRYTLTLRSTLIRDPGTPCSLGRRCTKLPVIDAAIQFRRSKSSFILEYHFICPRPLALLSNILVIAVSCLCSTLKQRKRRCHWLWALPSTSASCGPMQHTHQHSIITTGRSYPAIAPTPTFSSHHHRRSAGPTTSLMYSKSMPLILSVVSLHFSSLGSAGVPPHQHHSTISSLPHPINQTHLLEPHHYSIHPARRSGLRPHAPQNHWDCRSPGHLAMYECHYANWAGECRLVNADGGSCHNIQWPNTAAPGYSTGPDKGLRCVIFSEPNCIPTSTVANNFIWPSFADFSTNATWDI